MRVNKRRFIDSIASVNRKGKHIVIGLLILGIYLTGLLVFTYPIYFKLVMAKRNASVSSFIYEFSYEALPVFAFILSLGWFLATPFFISYWLHNRKLPSVRDTKYKAEQLEQRQRQYDMIKASVDADAEIAMRAALRELDGKF